MLAAVRELPDADLRQSFAMGAGSLFGIVVHCYGAELVWAGVIDETDPARSLPNPEAFASLKEVVAAWDKLDERWDRFLAGVTEKDLDTQRTRVREGKSYSRSLGDILIHVCMHQMYHAAQFKNMLRQVGATELPVSDYIVFARGAHGP